VARSKNDKFTAPVLKNGAKKLAGSKTEERFHGRLAAKNFNAPEGQPTRTTIVARETENTKERTGNVQITILGWGEKNKGHKKTGGEPGPKQNFTGTASGAAIIPRKPQGTAGAQKVKQVPVNCGKKTKTLKTWDGKKKKGGEIHAGENEKKNQKWVI